MLYNLCITSLAAKATEPHEKMYNVEDVIAEANSFFAKGRWMKLHSVQRI